MSDITMLRHADEWVSYCSHVDDDTGAQTCRCAPDLREAVEERDAAQQQLKGAVEALRQIAAWHEVDVNGEYTKQEPMSGYKASMTARMALNRLGGQ